MSNIEIYDYQIKDVLRYLNFRLNRVEQDDYLLHRDECLQADLQEITRLREKLKTLRFYRQNYLQSIRELGLYN